MEKVADAHLHVDEMEYHHSSGGAACGESQVGRVEGQLHHGAVRIGVRTGMMRFLWEEKDIVSELGANLDESGLF